MDDTLTLAEALEDLVSAEDFLDFFGISYEPSVVHVNRLHILQRWHDYLTRYPLPETDENAQHAHYQQWLGQAYQDFVVSDAQTEKVFRVFQSVDMPGGGHSTFVSLDRIFQS